MAVYSGFSSVTAVSGASVDTVILTKPTLNGVTVLNDTGTASLWFTVSTIGGPNLQPAVNGTNSVPVPAAIGAVTESIISHNGVVVNITSSGTPTYTVSIL